MTTPENPETVNILCAGPYAAELRAAVDAARAAGRMLHDEFHRPGGPRGPRAHCPADGEAEALIRRRLGDAFPAYGLRGEELPAADRPAAAADGPVWLIDPNDGTSSFQRGWRGAAVSIALVHQGRPVLGVVYAYAARAGYGDLFTWALGAPLSRNGVALADVHGAVPAVVLLSQAADRKPAVNARLCAPRRYRGEPSIAYRLALAAAGEGAAAVSLNSPTDWDVAAGHALLLGAGGDLLRMDGAPVVYDAQGSAAVGDCAGGTGSAPAELVRRPWAEVFQPVSRPDDSYGLLEADPARLVADPALLDRAQGCLLGQIAGDNLGAQVEFQSAAEIARAYPEGLRDLADGGQWGILAGQPTDDSELALALARSIVRAGAYDPAAAAAAYAGWFGSGPFDVGTTTATALEPALAALRSGGDPAAAAAAAARQSMGSEANGALMRVSPLAIWGHRLADDVLAAHARADAALTHANAVCGDAGAVFCVAVAAALRGADPAAAYAHALDWARAARLAPSVLEAVARARVAPPADYQRQMGWVLIALQNAFHELLHAAGPAEGVARTVARGGDTDTNGAIAGALLGAAWGATAMPLEWMNALLACRPQRETPGCRCPRPAAFWPVDFRLLAEHLTALGRARLIVDG